MVDKPRQIEMQESPLFQKQHNYDENLTWRSQGMLHQLNFFILNEISLKCLIDVHDIEVFLSNLTL